ncbi:hypothetical protein GUITHDRAFT_146568 [Guillardia theta CCMP2712]|uniref:alanine--glyoxylate transaminase n=1 Tax=Guillardia theta (strain CCMP2712) TaxID=905079 RepID=L1IHT5_GUITC|nr:hypothetical protein GUITHDRAFT_146568 [Guillardia theta CCMP2712]EKX35370.1 hypothetical protein GUITHDRAFT_146568 [Guillardia theta CCMP2712]|eukprot:XP_005822350.1 hypothetical protein GUITHDRAFT_146568 [Guillardia theta CCMP2712]
MSLPQVGHLDPYFLELMEDIKSLLRYSFQTTNDFTIPVSGTGSAAMEACVCNLIEPGDVFLVGCNGYFGYRLVEMGKRYGAVTQAMVKPWGEVFSYEEVKAAVEKHKPAVLALIHAETSTGACQPFEGIGELCRKHNCLLIADCVTSISGVPLFLDKWGIDAAYAGTQKALSCPPGVAPLSFNKRAMQKLMSRKTAVANWYLDMRMIAAYLTEGGGGARSYHHTAPISMCYALREALEIVREEGLESRWRRHQQVAEGFWKELEAMGLELLVDHKHRLPTLTTIKVPAGVDPKQVTSYILSKYQIEIGNGLGELAGKCFRVGLMGVNARSDIVLTILAALRDALEQQGYQLKPKQKMRAAL